MKIYRHPVWEYFVINHGCFFFRIGYKLRRWHFVACRYNRCGIYVFSLWIAGLFLQFDYEKKSDRMKQTISKLLEEIAQFELTLSIDLAAEKVQFALDAGEFDCLVQHLANEPPDDDRDVLTLLHVGDGYRYWRENNYRRKWLYDRECVVSWCELPLIKRSNDAKN